MVKLLLGFVVDRVSCLLVVVVMLIVVCFVLDSRVLFGKFSVVVFVLL